MIKKTIYLTRRLCFSAAHKLYDETKSLEENKKVFGNCSNLHGHNFELFITLKGTPDKNSGMIINARDIKRIAHKYVIDEFDHATLNDIKDFKKVLPTTENICIVIWNRLEPIFKEKLYEIKVKETENIECCYRGI